MGHRISGKGGEDGRQCKPWCSAEYFQTSPYKCSTHLDYLKVWESTGSFTYSPIYTPAEGCCTSLCFTWVWCSLLSFMDSVKVEQLLLKNGVGELGALLFSSNGFPGHSYYPWSVCLTPISVRAFSWNKSIGIHNGKCEYCQLCRALQGLLQTDRTDVEDTKSISFSKDSASSLSKVRQ